MTSLKFPLLLVTFICGGVLTSGEITKSTLLSRVQSVFSNWNTRGFCPISLLELVFEGKEEQKQKHWQQLYEICGEKEEDIVTYHTWRANDEERELWTKMKALIFAQGNNHFLQLRTDVQNQILKLPKTSSMNPVKKCVSKKDPCFAKYLQIKEKIQAIGKNCNDLLEGVEALKNSVKETIKKVEENWLFDHVNGGKSMMIHKKALEVLEVVSSLLYTEERADEGTTLKNIIEDLEHLVDEKMPEHKDESQTD